MPFASRAKRRAACRAHYRQHKAEYLIRNKVKRRKLLLLVRMIKGAVGCARCHKVRDWRMLDFHHIDSGTKCGDIARIVTNGSWKQLFNEIAKCVVLCRNCHARHQYWRKR